MPFSPEPGFNGRGLTYSQWQSEKAKARRRKLIAETEAKLVEFLTARVQETRLIWGLKQAGEPLFINGPEDTQELRLINGPENTQDSRLIKGPENTQESRLIKGPENTQESHLIKGPENALESRPINGPKHTQEPRLSKLPENTRAIATFGKRKIMIQRVAPRYPKPKFALLGPEKVGWDELFVDMWSRMALWRISHTRDGFAVMPWDPKKKQNKRRTKGQKKYKLRQMCRKSNTRDPRPKPLDV
ncbi:hypothetical protein PT974_02173 [Cladobotryum mycophilum]|uniref:Uncharacterized protein n=1 Tax=Cladobotryum mycophilum TaxID=491253 RepID=A0ABR0SXF8_9HYPO